MRTVRSLALVGLLLGLVLPQSASAAGLAPQTTWHGKQIHLYDAQRAGYDGRGVTVAVLDGWVDTHHKDFEGRAVQAADCTSGGCSTTALGSDHCGQDHGTHVAGTIASSSYGVARRARLLAVRVLAADSQGDCAGTAPEVAAGITWAVDNGAQVINLSLGPDVAPLGTHNAITAAVHDAAARGVVVVFSAGNQSTSVAPADPGDALVVAATGPSGGLTSYTQRGQGVSVAAPGGQPGSVGKCSESTCVVSLYPQNRYAVAAGTSMAAPHVAGLAALLLQQGRSRSQVIQRIEGTAHPLAGAGSGLIDAAAALGVRTGTAPRATAPRTSSPKPRVAPQRRPATVHAARSPAPIARPTSPAATASSPAAAPAPTVSAAPTLVTAGSGIDDEEEKEIPLPLAGIAGALIGLAAAALLLLGRP